MQLLRPIVLKDFLQVYTTNVQKYIQFIAYKNYKAKMDQVKLLTKFGTFINKSTLYVSLFRIPDKYTELIVFYDTFIAEKCLGFWLMCIIYSEKRINVS